MILYAATLYFPTLFTTNDALAYLENKTNTIWYFEAFVLNFWETQGYIQISYVSHSVLTKNDRACAQSKIFRCFRI